MRRDRAAPLPPSLPPHPPTHAPPTPLQVAKYIDMPLQHIDNLVLLSMNRPPREHTVGLLAKLRERIPDLALRTTFISGEGRACSCGVNLALCDLCARVVEGSLSAL